MHRTTCTALVAFVLAIAPVVAQPAIAQATAAPAVVQQQKMSLTWEGLGTDGTIPPSQAFCAYDDSGKLGNGGNQNPAIRWQHAPEGTKSFAVVMLDPDVPQDTTKAGREDYTIPENAKRQNFYHWVMFNIPATATEIAAGADSNAVKMGGKSFGKTPLGMRARNDYARFFRKNPGPWGGYDGPCPPFNDARLHHYTITVYALGVPELKIPGAATGHTLQIAMRNHILASASVTGTYTLNKTLLHGIAMPDASSKTGSQ